MAVQSGSNSGIEGTLEGQVFGAEFSGGPGGGKKGGFEGVLECLELVGRFHSGDYMGEVDMRGVCVCDNGVCRSIILVLYKILGLPLYVQAQQPKAA